MTTMVAISGNQMAPFPGGILLMLGDTIVGAVGVSGAAGDEDEYCAIQAVIEANLGLTTVPEQHSCSTVMDGKDEDGSSTLPAEPLHLLGSNFSTSFKLPY